MRRRKEVKWMKVCEVKKNADQRLMGKEGERERLKIGNEEKQKKNKD